MLENQKVQMENVEGQNRVWRGRTGELAPDATAERHTNSFVHWNYFTTLLHREC